MTQVQKNIFDDEKLNLNIKEKLSSLTTKPGVYLHKNKNGKIIYVGKAKNLRNRVKSYFQKGRPADAKTKALIRHIADFEVIVVDSEAEALILEDTLIKKYKPKYNILLRDDKSYPYVRVTKEDYPRIFATRKIIKDGSKYFGPFTDGKQLKRVLRTIRSIFLLRSCDYNITAESIKQHKYKICLDYHIKKCEAPCEGLISKEKYNENIKNAIQILNGKTRDVKKQLLEQMETLANEMKFEDAAIIKNRFLILQEYLEHQKVVTTDPIDRDVIGISRIDNSVCSLILKIRDGKLIGKRHFIIPNAKDDSDAAILQSTIEKWYLESESVPKELFLPELPTQLDFIQNWLNKQRNKNVDIIVPKIGEKKKLIAMASTNAEFMLREYHIAIAKREQSLPRSVQSLQRDLRLKKLPRHIECFDNSHIQGSELVSSCVVFINGKPKKSEYRKFKIQTVKKNDDFAAMKEAVYRRYKRLVDEKKALPDLVIIDGGKGQLSSAMTIFKDLNIDDKITVVGLAKRLDEVFFPNNPDSVLLPKTSSSLKLIQRVRDEAHRFAITFHKKLREKRTLQTELTNIKGVGEKTSQKLLIEFGSVKNIKIAEKEMLIKAIGESLGLSVYNFYHNETIENSS